MARRALGPATLAVVQAVEAALLPADTALLTACSGGQDSLALAYGVGHVARRRGLPYVAVVVDHGLQDGSGQVAAQALDGLRGLGYGDAVVVPVALVDDGSGPEAAARAARYAALDAATAARGATLVLGHTLDDQAETVLLGLARGSGPRSLAGMPVRSGSRLRPLLGLRRTVTAAACAELGLTPWTDPHNADPRFARVRARDRVLPVLEAELGPGIAEALSRTADLARADSDLLDRLAAQALEGVADDDLLDCAGAAALPDALRTRVVRRWLLDHGARDLSRVHVDAVDALLLDWHGQGPVSLTRLVVRRQAGVLRAAVDVRGPI